MARVARYRNGVTSPSTVNVPIAAFLLPPLMHMSDGTRYVFSRISHNTGFDRVYGSLRQSWYNALNEAQSNFRKLLTSASAPEWKRVPIPNDSTSARTKGKGRALTSLPEPSDVVIHRRANKAEEAVYRIVLDVPTGEEAIALDAWKSVLATPELRREWDPAVEGASLVEMFDPTTRISKTNFTLGWPAKYVEHLIPERHILTACAAPGMLLRYLAHLMTQRPS